MVRSNGRTLEPWDIDETHGINEGSSGNERIGCAQASQEEQEENRTDEKSKEVEELYDDVDEEGSNVESQLQVHRNSQFGKRRGRPRGSKNKVREKGRKRSGAHYTDEDCLILAKARITQSERCIQSEESMWDGIRKRCEQTYNLVRSKSSLRNKWASIRHDDQLWLVCVNRVRQKLRTGNILEE